MADSPAFQWYPADYLADLGVQVLTTAQEGIYIRLLCYCWREGSLPNDSIIVRRMCKPDAKLADVSHVLETFFIPADQPGKLTNKRLEKERAKQADRRKQASEAGKKSGTKRQRKTNGRSISVASSLERNVNGGADVRCDSVPTKSNPSSSSSISSSASAFPPTPPATKTDHAWEIPQELDTPEFREAWSDWVKHRAEKRQKVTPTAGRNALVKLARWGPARAVAAIKHSLANNWQGIFEEDGNGSAQKQSGKSAEQNRLQNSLDVLAQFAAGDTDGLREGDGPSLRLEANQ